jgi:hypothetical protein
VSILPPASIRLSDYEHRQIEREAGPKSRKTAGQHRQELENVTDAWEAATDRAGWLELLLEDALRELVRRQRLLDTYRLGSDVDRLLIDTLLERTAT